MPENRCSEPRRNRRIGRNNQHKAALVSLFPGFGCWTVYCLTKKFSGLDPATSPFWPILLLVPMGIRSLPAMRCHPNQCRCHSRFRFRSFATTKRRIGHQGTLNRSFSVFSIPETRHPIPRLPRARGTSGASVVSLVSSPNR